MRARRLLGKTQKQMAELLGISLKAVCSYEQGWRRVPPHVERQVYFLIASRRGLAEGMTPCWEAKDCPDERRRCCPAWEFNAGRLCWFISGTVCECNAHRNWDEKMRICKECHVLGQILDMFAEP
ncbi:helix-turn-helix domain-containing protein [Dissulfurirhabdus thermomarina]|nr:helix-turn-helix transcriptional regulator [Dissulfurirhabdus thermomarina]